MIKIKRAYEEPADEDGYRILVDRLWPRGLSKNKSRIPLWLKDIAPSDELRKWFAHDLSKWERFKRRYKEELKTKTELLNKIRLLEKEKEVVTLIYVAKDNKHNNAAVLQEVLEAL